MSAITGVSRYLAKQTLSENEVTETTGVEKYLARQANLNTATARIQTGVEKYLRNLG